MFGFDLYQLIVIAFLALAAVVILLSGRNNLRNGFIIFILSIGLGYRSVYLTSVLTIHPAEVLIWGLFLLLLLQRRLLPEGGGAFWLPLWVKLLIPFWLLAWITGYGVDRSWELMLRESKNFFVLLPMFFVANTVLAERKNWRPIILTFFLTGVWIAGIGLLEYYVPGVVSFIPGFASIPLAQTTVEGFQRASFSFYGSAAAAFTLVICLPMAHVLWDWFRSPSKRILTLLGSALLIGGIFIAGYRSIWFVLIIVLGLWVLFRFGLLVGLIVSAISVPAVLGLLPSIAEERFISMLLALEGGPADSSAVTRLLRTEVAWARTLQQPWGSGWGGSGWVHNDILQVSVAQGLLAALILALGWLATVFHLGSSILNLRRLKGSHFLPESLLLTLIAAAGVMVTQGITWQLQLALPVWFAWVLAGVWLHQVETEPAEETREEALPTTRNPWLTTGVPPSPSYSPPTTAQSASKTPSDPSVG